MASTPESLPLDLPSVEVLRHIVDVHCHPTDAPAGISDSSMDQLQIKICAMSTMPSDQAKVRDLGLRFPEKVVPCFGYHPWFSYLISTASTPVGKEEHYRTLFLSGNKSVDSDTEAQFQQLLARLPDPRPLSSVIGEVRRHLAEFPHAMVGEVGVDRIFRVPFDYFSSPRILTAFHIPLSHQITVLEAQLELAVEMKRNVSIHSVKAQQATIDLLGFMKKKHSDKWNEISVDMHSCGFSVQSWREVEKKHENAFLSLSTVINHRHGNHRELIAACSSERLLVESDYNDINMCTLQTWQMINVVANVKGWPIETDRWSDNSDKSGEGRGVVHRLEENWERFKKGRHPLQQTRKQAKKPEFYSEGSCNDQ